MGPGSDEALTDELDDGPHEDDFADPGVDDDLGSDEADPERDRSWRRGFPAPRLTILATPAGFRWAVRSIDHGSTDPADLAADVELDGWLEGLAELVVQQFPAALSARTVGDALLAFTGLSAADLADRIGCSDSELSRLRPQLVRLPGGLVSVDTLTWFGPSGGKQTDVRAVREVATASADLLVANARPRVWSARMNEIASAHGLSTDTVAGYRRAIEKALRRPRVVRSFQARFPLASEAALAAALDDNAARNQRVRQLLLSGCLDAALATVERAAHAEEGPA